MAKIERVFVEFGGDPSNDKECYKRYTSTEPFEGILPSDEVLEFVSKEKFDALDRAFRAAKLFIEATPCDPDINNYQAAKWVDYLNALKEIGEEHGKVSLPIQFENQPEGAQHKETT